MLKDQIEILLVDDHKVLRDGLRALLESEDDMTVIAEADTGEQAVQLSVTLKPDIIVMDLGLPDISGLDAIRLIRRKNQTSRIVVLSMYTRREFVVPALEAGCDGYVPKSSTHTSLLQAIRVVLKGDRFLHPAAATALVESLTGEQSAAEKFLLLSDREQEVLRLSARGFSSREIGEKLLISPKTAETYRQRAMDKLNLEHRPALIQFALKAGILYATDD
jgi:two-component system response regulator NreC